MSKWLNRNRGWIKKRQTETESFMGSDSPDTPEDEEVYGIVYHPIKHPLCVSKEVLVYKTMGKTRYYYCKQCRELYPDTPKKYCFKVIEADD